MKDFILTDVVTWVWLLLVGLTGVSWWLGATQGHAGFSDPRYITVSLMVLAFFKVRLVILYFMEIRTAPLPLRCVFEAWVVLVCVTVNSIYLAT